MPDLDLLTELTAAGTGRGALVGLVVGAEGTAAASWTLGGSAVVEPDALLAVDSELRPRWVMWSQDTATELVRQGVRLSTAWDIAAVHRLLAGGWRADPGRVWAWLHGLPADTIPVPGPVDLFSQADPHDPDPEGPVQPDGHLRPEWVGGDWADSPDRLQRWARLALEAAHEQQAAVARVDERPRLVSTARSESTAELLCAELAADGLPVDRAEAERIVGAVVGPRPRNETEAAAIRAERDAVVLQHVPADANFDLRSPGQVKSLLRRVGIEVPDTRAWRLEPLRDAHPVVEALLMWRKAERVATTYGYGWLDEHVGPDGRLRGTWPASDGAAGRMTASAGLHNMPVDLRGAVLAEPGHVFVRADLGQIEPRVLAAVSGDRAFAAATQDDDLYTPVATQLGVDRATAKVAILGAMYGQTTGRGAQVLPRLHAAYPVAMALLDEADRAAQVGTDLRTYGGRLVRMGVGDQSASERELRARAGARGRYGRNAMIQGAAAELFKVWAVTVRARAAALDARIVLCLHDELLVHAPAEHGEAVAALLDACLQESAHRWAPDDSVRFVADIAVIRCWADAKG